MARVLVVDDDDVVRDMEGFALVAALRERPDFADVSIIFLSGRIEDAQIADGRRMGATYLTKPFIASALLHTIERATAVAEQSW